MCETRNSNLFGKITILFVICCCSLPAQAKYGGGTGEPNDPYLIFDANQMNAIGTDSNDWDRHFKLMADIDLSGYTGPEPPPPPPQLSPPPPMADIDLGRFTDTEFNIIGYFVNWGDNKPFSGVFDGNGHTISNFTYTSTAEDNIGIFGYVEGSGEIKDLGLIDPDVDVGRVDRVGSLVGRNDGGNITDCYAEGGSVSGHENVGGLVGLNWEGTISNSYSTGSVSGDWHVGGLVGTNIGTITNCYSTGSVSGVDKVGGLVGVNGSPVPPPPPPIPMKCSNSRVDELTLGEPTATFQTNNGVSIIGGYASFGEPDSHGATINNCYASGDVSGSSGVGVGGLVGLNWEGTITNCYSTGDVAGNYDVGGLVGYKSGGTVSSSFWDIETSGQQTSAGGMGKTTAEMQTASTFTNSGWDFVGETLNGIEDIWFIPQQDYPHLWWEGMQVPMKLTPRTLNCRSKGNWVKAHLTLPQGVSVADVDPDRPAVLHSFGFESAPLHIFVNENERVQIEAAFEREAVCSLTGDWPQKLTVAGFLTDGNIFLGTSKVRMIAPGLKEIGELALYWLNADCVQPDFCDRIDMNRDSLVNLLDYALLLNSQVEFVSE